MTLVRFDGAKRADSQISSVELLDISGVKRKVAKGATVDLADSEIARLSTFLKLPLSTDPVQSAAVADDVITRNELMDVLDSLGPKANTEINSAESSISTGPIGQNVASPSPWVDVAGLSLQHTRDERPSSVEALVVIQAATADVIATVRLVSADLSTVLYSRNAFPGAGFKEEAVPIRVRRLPAVPSVTETWKIQVRKAGGAAASSFAVLNAGSPGQIWSERK